MKRWEKKAYIYTCEVAKRLSSKVKFRVTGGDTNLRSKKFEGFVSVPTIRVANSTFVEAKWCP